jgi:uncharacterized protein (TIGR02646 family)
MIYINRNRIDEDGNLIKPPDDWFQTARAATDRAIREEGDHKPDPNIYGHDHVRAALEKLFYDKCAYCRSEITRMDWNVEHFRPKGHVAERPNDHQGYYWLLYEWTNLYPSCIYCNQRRRDKPRWGDLTYASAGGKMDQFPLENEDTRAMSHHDDVDNERILLIDPCNDQPDNYLSYDGLGNIIALDDALQNKSRGRATIEVFNLKARRLRDSRRDIIDYAVAMLNLIRKMEARGNSTCAAEIKEVFITFALDDHCEHAGVAHAVEKDPDAFGVSVY